MSVNKAILIGNVGKDPEVRYLENGTPVSTFSLATTESYTNKSGERVDNTEWHNVVVWRGLAEIAQKYVKKGSQIYIEGRIRYRTYDDKDGVKRYITEIVADNLRLLGRRQDDGSVAPSTANINAPTTSIPTQNKTSEQDVYSPSSAPVDDLPF